MALRAGDGGSQRSRLRLGEAKHLGHARRGGEAADPGAGGDRLVLPGRTMRTGMGNWGPQTASA